MTQLNSTFLYYFTEFRKRLLKSILLLIFLFIFLSFFANDLYTLLAAPLLKFLPSGHKLIATQIVSPFFIPFELSFFVALFLMIPFFLYQIWAFIAPALYLHEKQLVWPLLCMSILLFYLGMLFAYFIFFPILFNFLAKTTPVSVVLSPDIAEYYHFTLKLFLIFGMIFEVPVATILVIMLNVVSRENLIRLRPFVIVGAFIIGMLIAPPDIVSQTLLALPLWILFEIGIFVAPFFMRIKFNREIT